MKSVYRLQRGIAVITVLLALAIAVIICSEVIMRVHSSIQRSSNYFNTQQSWEYALGAEAMARQVLAADYEKDKASVQVDHLLEAWALPAQKITVPGGTVQFEIYDMQARFNLNNIVDEDGQIQPEQVGILQNLFTYLGVRSNYADLAARWASYDNDTGDVYGSDKIPYRAADTQFGSVSELRQLPDIQMDEYSRAAPFLSALPLPVKININTAPAPVLAALINASAEDIERLNSFIEQRKQQPNGYESADDFISMMGTDADIEDTLSTSSEYFEVRAIAEYGDSKVWLISTLFRDGQTGEISLLSRDTSQRFSFEAPAAVDNSSKKDTGLDFDNKENADENSGLEGEGK